VANGADFEQRTDYAEFFVEQLASEPLISECVYRSPQRADATQKEVVDLLLTLAGESILVSLKCQQEPGTRPPAKEARWGAKAAAGAASQIKGALGSLKTGPFWCEHPRRGRVEFVPGELRPLHGIVLVEVTYPVTLPAELPLHADGVPLSYLTVNDFCNIVRELRSLPEIGAYLDARRALPLEALRRMGEEKSLYEYYLLNGESFAGCLGQCDARLVAGARAVELRGALRRKAELDFYSHLVERVADCLAERNPEYMEGMPEEYRSYFDSPGGRTRYLKLQEELGRLRLPERGMLGRHFAGLIDKTESDPTRPTMAYTSVRNDGDADFIYVLVSARGESRPLLVERTRSLLLGAMAFYGRRRGMAIADRDSVSFEVMLFEVPQHSITAFHFGEQMFGKLRTTQFPIMLVPEDASDGPLRPR
jgi:hypothetical protein